MNHEHFTFFQNLRVTYFPPHFNISKGCNHFTTNVIVKLGSVNFFLWYIKQ